MKGGAVLLAILLGIFLAVGQCGSAGEKGDHGRSSRSSDDDHDRAASDRRNTDGPGTEHTEAMTRHLESQGIQVKRVARRTDDDCAANSYGEVRSYFTDHPCRGLERAWYELGDDRGNAAVMSVAWVEMPSAEDTAALQRVVDRPGTGNIAELPNEDGANQDVSYNGWYYRSDRKGTTYSNVLAKPRADTQGSRELARRAAGAPAPD